MRQGDVRMQSGGLHLLITGVTGFVGSELLRSLLPQPAVESVTVPVRPWLGMEPGARLTKLRAYWSRYDLDVQDKDWQKLKIVGHDLSERLSPIAHRQVTHIFHAAASTSLDQSLIQARQANLYSTQNLLLLAQNLPSLRRFVHFSTAYVAGKSSGRLRESDQIGGRFHNHYERSKAEAEASVRLSKVPYTILRPSIIVGRSDSGYVYRMKVLYSVWRIWLAGVIPRAPLDPLSWVDLVPIDFVVEAAKYLSQAEPALNQTVHLVAGEDRQSPMEVMRLAARVFNVKEPPLSPPWIVPLLKLPFVRPLLAHALGEALDKMHTHVPYIGLRDRVFDETNLSRLLRGSSVKRPKFQEYGERLFQFCRDSAWGKRPLLSEDLCSKSA